MFWREWTRYDSCVPRKSPHTPAEIAALAERLRESRPEGMPVEAWLTQKHGELRSMTRGSRSWSWDEIAAALNMAGITYRAGVKRADGGVSRGRWTALQLQNKVRLLRDREQVRRAAAAGASNADALAAVIEALVRRGVLSAAGGTTSVRPPDPATPRDAIRRLADPAATPDPAPTPAPAPQAQPPARRVRVFGDVEPEPPEEPSPLERMQAEKQARTRAIIAEWQAEERKRKDGDE